MYPDNKSTPELGIGPVVVGVLINTYLFGAVTCQYLVYFLHKWNDPLWIRLSVVILCMTDVFYSIAVIQLVWIYCISAINNPVLLEGSKWPLVFTPFVTAVSSFLTHNVMGYRIYRMTNRRSVYIAILVISIFPFLLGLGLSVGPWIMISKHRWIQVSPSLSPVYATWMVLQGTADIITTSTLTWLFYKSRTGQVRIDVVLKRLIRGVIQTGFLALLFGMGCLIMSSTRRNTRLASLFAIPIGRIYSTTLLDTLIVRPSLRSRLLQHVDLMRQSPSQCIWVGNQDIMHRDSKESSPNNHHIEFSPTSRPYSHDEIRFRCDCPDLTNNLPIKDAGS